ncbi:Protein CBG27624 [Caenorhabditis briggsae]|uniref:Protein CBG27624 n=1 Tax=Caenorhabditis briggsae TaxID=6238 RepID=B6IJ69_CAEBR|nr:Protein CBG27624 [Caenorhabditis briggsae]CAR99903.1 Protein CBG27624 [Caenorhabditis briggsae]
MAWKALRAGRMRNMRKNLDTMKMFDAYRPLLGKELEDLEKLESCLRGALVTNEGRTSMISLMKRKKAGLVMPEPECLALVLSDQEIEERKRIQHVQQPVQQPLVQQPIQAQVRSVSPPPVQTPVLQIVQPSIAQQEDDSDHLEMDSDDDEIADGLVHSPAENEEEDSTDQMDTDDFHSAAVLNQQPDLHRIERRALSPAQPMGHSPVHFSVQQAAGRPTQSPIQQQMLLGQNQHNQSEDLTRSETEEDAEININDDQSDVVLNQLQIQNFENASDNGEQMTNENESDSTVTGKDQTIPDDAPEAGQKSGGSSGRLADSQTQQNQESSRNNPSPSNNQLGHNVPGFASSVSPIAVESNDQEAPQTFTFILPGLPIIHVPGSAFRAFTSRTEVTIPLPLLLNDDLSQSVATLRNPMPAPLSTATPNRENQGTAEGVRAEKTVRNM